MAAMLAPLAHTLYHRNDAFYKVFQECRTFLAPLFGTQRLPYILTASGTGALEAAVVNFTAPEQDVVVVNAGKFGERWEKLLTRYQCRVHALKVPWGNTPKMADLTTLLQKVGKPAAVFFQANETSTGVQFAVPDITRTIRQYCPDALIVVDAVSSLGAHGMEMDAWEIDCAVAGSQKGLGVPPGLAFIAVSERAWQRRSSRPRFYFDLEIEDKNQAKGTTAWTPAITLVQSLHASLLQIQDKGVPALIAFHKLRADAVRAAVKALGLKLFAEASPSDALTAIALPDGLDGKQLVRGIRQRFGFVFAGGQDHLEGRLLRFSHLGYYDRFDILSGVAALEFGLKECGHPVKLGTGVTAAMQVFGDYVL